MIVEEKENGGVFPIHKFHIEMKMDFYLGIDFGNKYFRYKVWMS